MSRIADSTDAADQRRAQPRFTRGPVTWLCYWMLGYFAFLQAVLGPLMPFIRSDLKLSYTVASLHFSAFALGAVLMGTASDRITRRWGRQTSFWGGGAGMAVGAALLMLSPVVIGTILGSLLMGALGNLLLVTLQAALADGHGPSSVVALTEANVMASAFAILAAVSVGALTGLGLGWRLVIPPAIVMLALVAVRFRATAIPQPRPVRQRAEGHATRPPRLPLRYWIFWLVIILETGVEWCVAYWGASFLTAYTRLRASDAATAMGAFFLAMLIGRYGGSRLSRVIAGQTVLLIALAVGLLGFPLFWLAPFAPLRLVGLFVVGLGLANVYPVGVALATNEAPGQADQATARLAVAGGVAVLLAPLALGALSDAVGIGHAFAVAMPLLLLALLAAFLAIRTPTTDVTTQARGTR
ncbi:MAG TPA: MFS transporter [Ktedonobacterales bacterium]|nr:MFS transporter [Ktedonobacterales bacterium]